MQAFEGFKTQGPQDFSHSINWKELDSAQGLHDLVS